MPNLFVHNPYQHVNIPFVFNPYFNTFNIQQMTNNLSGMNYLYAPHVPIQSHVSEQHTITNVQKSVSRTMADLNQPKIEVVKDERIKKKANKTGLKEIWVPKPT